MYKSTHPRFVTHVYLCLTLFSVTSDVFHPYTLPRSQLLKEFTPNVIFGSEVVLGIFCRREHPGFT